MRALAFTLAATVSLGGAAWGQTPSQTASGQPPQPTERMTFRDAVQRAIEKNPSAAIAAAGILRADALLRQARAATLPQVSATVTTTTLNKGTEFQGTTVTPRNSVTGVVDATMALYAPVAWALRTQAEDQKTIAEISRAETARQTALGAADAYLTIIARRRTVEANVRARDTALAHFNLARELQERGSGSLLNQLRAQQELSIDEGLVEGARLALYQAQEALGVLLAAEGPVDAADEPDFSVPASSLTAPTVNLGRSDLRLFTAEQSAAERVVRDSTRDRFPSLSATFEPQSTYPSPFFTPSNSWRFLLQLSVPIFDSGQRTGARVERQAAVDVARANLAGALTRASSEVRSAREAVASAGRSLASARAGADQAQQVVNIVNVSFRAGAATNIEVIDAEQRARDADTTVANAEDELRRARLDLLDALGLFP
jgi:outer membrane protein TolC